MKRSKWLQYGQLILGSVLFVLAVNCFIDPCGLNTGGFVGFAQILSWLFTGNFRLTGMINFCFNIPLFILSWKSISRGFFKKTVLSLVIQSVLLSVMPVLSTPVFEDVLSNVIFGAVIGGIGIGLCLLSSGSAGGLDILGVYFSTKGSNISVGKISYIINAFVLGLSAILFNLQAALYSLIFILLMYFVCDRMHYQNISVYAIIITRDPQIKTIITENTRRGVTWWNGKGAYTNSDTEILLCIMDRYEVAAIKKMVHKQDPSAFFLLCKGKPLLGNYEKHLIV